MSAVQFENEIRWDGNSLAVWATVNGSRIFCEIPRSTIYNVPLFDDGITREIARDRAEIFDRLRPAVIAKIACTTDSSMRKRRRDLVSWDVMNTSTNCCGATRKRRWRASPDSASRSVQRQRTFYRNCCRTAEPRHRKLRADLG